MSAISDLSDRFRAQRAVWAKQDGRCAYCNIRCIPFGRAPDGTYQVRVNGNVRPLSHVQHLMAMEAFRAARGPLTA